MNSRKGGNIEELSRSGTDVTYTVDLSSINIKDIPDLSKYKHCKSLDLSCNQISTIWQEVFQVCPYLKEIKLYSNKLEKIEGIKNLQHLENLQLQYNRISSLTEGLTNCKNLRFLRLDSNRLTMLKASDVRCLNQLSYLDISANCLEDISFINVLSSLKELHCANNKLQKIPNLSSLTKLEEIDISHNVLTSLSGLKGMRNLKTLNARDNEIASLVPVDTLKSLTDLNISDNRLKKLPRFATQFPSLEVLSVAGNQLEKPDDLLALRKLCSLKELDIQNNPVTVDSSVLENLSVNLLEKLDLVFYNGKNIVKKDTQRQTRPKSAMRPMSANQLVSEKTISNQLHYDEMCLSDFEDRIKSQFVAVKGLLEELPKTKPIKKDGIFYLKILYFNSSDLELTFRIKSIYRFCGN